MSNTSRLMQAASAGVPGDKWTVNNVKATFRPLGQMDLAADNQIAWHPDGTYYFQAEGTSIRKYEAPSPWETQPVKFDSGNEFALTEDDFMYGVAFKDDGTKMFLTGIEFNRVYEYTLSAAWDITSPTFVRSYNLGFGTDFATSIVIGNNGTRRIVSRVGETDPANDRVYSYNLNIAWSLASVTATANSALPGLWGIALNTTGTALFAAKFEDQIVEKYTVGTAWRMNAIALDSSFDDRVWYANGATSSPENFPFIRNVTLKPDGTKMFLVTGIDGVYNYNLSTAYDLSTATRQLAAADYYKWPGTQTAYTIGKGGISFHPRGTSFYVADSFTSTVDQYALSVPYDIETASYVAQLDNVTPPADTYISRDGTLLFSTSGDYVKKYTLSSAFDITTATLTSTTQITEGSAFVNGIFFRDDGVKFYYISGGTLYEWTLATPFDLSTGTSTGSAVVVTSTPSFFSARVAYGIRFDNTGTKLLTVEQRRSGLGGSLSRNTLNAFALNVPWDLTSGFNGTPTTKSFFTDQGGNEDNRVSGFGVSPDGSYVFAPMLGQDLLLKYTLK